MAERQRSPFGELVFRYRATHNLTQQELAARASNPARPGPDTATVSPRTISAIEQLHDAGDAWVRPRPSTVRALADAFGLEPGSDAWEAFVLASHQDQPVVRPDPSFVQNGEAPLLDEAAFFIPAGREHHLARLSATIDRAVAGTSAVALLGGSPGIGKSSLACHAAREATDRHDNLVVLWGDCTGRSGAADPHQPFRQILGIMVGDTAAAGPQQLVSAQNRSRIEARAGAAIAALLDHADGLIDRLVPANTLRDQMAGRTLDDAIATRLRDLLATAPANRAHALGLNEQVYRALAAYAKLGPVVLVLEDLHWADVGTVSLLFHVLRRLHEQRLPIAIIGTWRPTHLDTEQEGERHPLAAIVREAPRYFPGSLLDLSGTVGGEAGRAFVEAMVDAIVPDAPIGLADALFRQTAGHPLFVAAMLRWYEVEGRRLDVIGDGAPHWTPDQQRLPAEIDVLFDDLVNRLPPDLQAVIGAASVQGATFSAEILMRVLGLSRPALIDLLDEQLMRRYKVIEPAGIVTIAHQRSHDYRFVHVLLRDYLYDRLSELERAHYHAATAGAMQEHYGGGEHDGASQIAFHLDRAGDARRAGRAYLTAGDHAMGQQHFEMAMALFRRVGELDLRETDPFSVAQALVGQGNCARGLGQRADAIRYLNRALDLAERERLPLVRANSLTSLAMLDFDAGHMRQAARRLEQAIDLLVEIDNLHEACRSLALLSHMLQGLGRYDEAAERAEQSLRMATELRDDKLLVTGMIARANCWLELGHYDEAIAVNQRGIDISGERGTLHQNALCRANMALAEVERGNPGLARQALAPVLAARSRIVDRLVGAAEFNAGVIEEVEGDLGAAQARYQASLDIRIAQEQAALIVDSLSGLMRIATAGGDHARMRALLADICLRVEHQGLDGMEHHGRYFISLVTTHLALNEPARARDYARYGLAFIGRRADLLADPRNRASYLGAVPSHRRLRELADELGVAIS